MTEQKKEIRKNPHPLIVKGIFYVTATFEDKAYFVSNGLSFLRFAKDDKEEIKKGDYVEVHGPVYQRKDAASAIITGEAIVRKLTEEEVEKYKDDMNKMFDGSKEKKSEKKTSSKKSTAKKSDENKLPWE